MPLDHVLKRVIYQEGIRSDCSVYLSISLAYMEKGNWRDARYFFQLAKQVKESYEEQYALELLEVVLQNKSLKEVRGLLDRLKEEEVTKT